LGDEGQRIRSLETEPEAAWLIGSGLVAFAAEYPSIARHHETAKSQWLGGRQSEGLPCPTQVGPSVRGEIMQCYFFNVHMDEGVITDSEGQRFRDADQAWEAARAMARDLMATDFRRPVNWSSCHVEVTDEAGEIVLELPFLEVVEFTKQPN